MKLVEKHIILHKGSFALSAEWQKIEKELDAAIQRVVWPPNSDGFYLDPNSKGKGRDEGNGVVPIKEACMTCLESHGWIRESHVKERVKGLGKLDIIKITDLGSFAVEWETGNISSSHRAINKICLHVLQNNLVGGILIVPSNILKQYLTDRIGNIGELMPYIPLWQALPLKEGVILIYVIENDGFRDGVPRIEKGTDGRALL